MITQALVANGAKVYITGRRQEVLQRTVEQYNSGPGSLHALPGDVSDKQDVLRLVKEIEQKEPKGIQLLVNNAGIARDQNTSFCIIPHFLLLHHFVLTPLLLHSFQRYSGHVRPQGHL